MSCISKITNSIRPLQENDPLKSQQLKKAIGLQVLGVIIAICAVALLALGIALVLHSPFGIIPLIASIPVFWLGHTLAVISKNYQIIAKNSSSYWTENLQIANEKKIRKDLIQNTMICKSCFSVSSTVHPEIQNVVQPRIEANINSPIEERQDEVKKVKNFLQDLEITKEVKVAENIKNLIEETDQNIEKDNQKLQKKALKELEEVKEKIQALEDKFPFLNSDEDKELEVLLQYRESHAANLKEKESVMIKNHKNLLNLYVKNFTEIISKESRVKILSPYLEKYPRLEELM